MKGKKKKEDTVESRHVTAENQSLLRTLIATKPMNDARYRPVKLLTLKKNILRVG